MRGSSAWGRREHRTGRASRSAFTIARAGRRAKPELWLFPGFVLFRPVIDGKASRPKKRRRRAFPLFFRWLRGNTKRRVVAGRLFFPCYLQEKTGPAGGRLRTLPQAARITTSRVSAGARLRD